MFLLVEIEDANCEAAMTAIAPFCSRPPVILWDHPTRPPTLPVGSVATAPATEDQEALAVRIVDAVRPTGKHKLRRDALRLVLGREDLRGGMLARHAGGNDALRNGVVALAKALRKFSPGIASPIDLLATREKAYQYGYYKQVRYKPTPLGLRVGEILASRGEI